VVAKVWERLVVSKQEAQQFGMELCELEVTKQYHMKISNRFPALENLNESECTNKAWENKNKTKKIPLRLRWQLKI